MLTVQAGGGSNEPFFSPVDMWVCNEGGCLLTVIKTSNTIWATPVPFEEPKIADAFSKAFLYQPCFKELQTCVSTLGETLCAEYQRLYGTSENMEGYLDGKPRSSEQVLALFHRDFFRYAPSLRGEDKAPTFWSGMVGIERKEAGSQPTFLGRIANGAGDEIGHSESGIFLTREVRGRGVGKVAFVVLLLHALVGHVRGFPVKGKPLTHFSATISSENPKAVSIFKWIERVNAVAERVLIQKTCVQRSYGPRYFVVVHADDIEHVVRSVLPSLDTQFTVNGLPFIDFKHGWQSHTEPPVAEGG